MGDFSPTATYSEKNATHFFYFGWIMREVSRDISDFSYPTISATIFYSFAKKFMIISLQTETTTFLWINIFSHLVTPQVLLQTGKNFLTSCSIIKISFVYRTINQRWSREKTRKNLYQSFISLILTIHSKKPKKSFVYAMSPGMFIHPDSLSI